MNMYRQIKNRLIARKKKEDVIIVVEPTEEEVVDQDISELNKLFNDRGFDVIISHRYDRFYHMYITSVSMRIGVYMSVDGIKELTVNLIKHKHFLDLLLVKENREQKLNELL